MPRGGPGQMKGGAKQSKVSLHPGRHELETMLLNDVPYSQIISKMKRLYPDAPELTASNLTNHKNRLLSQPITKVVQTEEGEQEVQMYLTGHHEAQAISIPKEVVPTTLPSLPEALSIIIAAGLQNIINNPALVTPEKLLMALDQLRKVGGGVDNLNELIGSWGNVEKRKQELTKKAKRTRKVTVEETTETEETSTEGADEAVTVEGEWTVDDLETLALPERVDDATSNS